MKALDAIISREDQYEVAKGRAEIAFTTEVVCTAVERLPEFFDARMALPRPYMLYDSIHNHSRRV